MRQWLRRWRWPAAVALALVLAVVATLATGAPPSRLPLAPDNPRPDGARAAAQILQREGVRIALRRTTAGAVAVTPEGGTIFVTGPVLLSDEQWAALLAAPADLVVTDVAFADLSPLTDALATTGEGRDGVRRPVCEDPDAQAAGTLSTGSGDVRARGPGAVVLCFPPGPGGRTGAYAVLEEDGRRIAVVANARPFTNAELADAGNAALVLRVLGRTEHLTWYIPSATDGAETEVPSLLPPGSGAVAWWAILLTAAAALWRGRRFGRLVAEPLPVVVPPAETTRGRARLYRRARAHAHAADALRSATAARVARRLGVAESEGPHALLAVAARAGGRDTRELDALLFGPAPADDSDLLALARALDALEREISR